MYIDSIQRLTSTTDTQIESNILKGTSGLKKIKLKRKSVKNAKTQAITDPNASNGSRDVPIQSQELGKDGHRHYVGFQPHFHLNMTSQMQSCKTLKN